ncbi:hypothetical protein [uncultured Thalassolituus sp.]|uniref:hypothetical protein n=1 Tax=uncultured Thalassolituus sp. TaxID=285273 RepID=UPI00260608DD|nr:hypothetical protein [uncultured Thalassolituus sp.]
MNEDDFEQRLKAFAKDEARQSQVAKPPADLSRALERARRETAYKEGLGFVTAIVWVLVAGLGLHLYRAVKTTGRQTTQNKTTEEP